MSRDGDIILQCSQREMRPDIHFVSCGECLQDEGKPRGRRGSLRPSIHVIHVTTPSIHTNDARARTQCSRLDREIGKYLGPLLPSTSLKNKLGKNKSGKNKPGKNKPGKNKPGKNKPGKSGVGGGGGGGGTQRGRRLTRHGRSQYAINCHYALHSRRFRQVNRDIILRVDERGTWRAWLHEPPLV